MNDFAIRSRIQSGRALIAHADTLAAMLRAIEDDTAIVSIDADREVFDSGEGWDAIVAVGLLRDAIEKAYELGGRLAGESVSDRLAAIAEPPAGRTMGGGGGVFDFDL